MNSSSDKSIRDKFWFKFTCQYYTELASKSLDCPLSLKEKLLFVLHHVICTVCRRFNRQLVVINKGLKKVVSNDGIDSELKLSDDVKESIKRKLKDSDY